MSSSSDSVSVLLVDDEVDLCEVMEGLIMDSSSAIECTRCHSGMDALEALSQRKYDIVVTDIKMPAMNGVELLEAVKSRFERPPQLYAITGFSDFDDDAICAAGALEVFQKPGDLARMVETVVAASHRVKLGGTDNLTT